jgi:hypothetical protein
MGIERAGSVREPGSPRRRDVLGVVLLVAALAVVTALGSVGKWVVVE